jgi:hypothetical protein
MLFELCMLHIDVNGLTMIDELSTDQTCIPTIELQDLRQRIEGTEAAGD